MEIDVIVDEGGHKVVAVVVPLLPPQLHLHLRNPRKGWRGSGGVALRTPGSGRRRRRRAGICEPQPAFNSRGIPAAPTWPLPPAPRAEAASPGTCRPCPGGDEERTMDFHIKKNLSRWTPAEAGRKPERKERGSTRGSPLLLLLLLSPDPPAACARGRGILPAARPRRRPATLRPRPLLQSSPRRPSVLGRE